jgi:hypothetical protein
MRNNFLIKILGYFPEKNDEENSEFGNHPIQLNESLNLFEG